VTFGLFLASLAFGAQIPQQDTTEKVRQYIKALSEQESMRYSIGENFSGEFRPLPTEMESQLLKSFPNHRFLLASGAEKARRDQSRR